MLTARIWTGVIGGAVFLSAIWLGGWWFEAFLLAVCLVGFSELLRMGGLSFYGLPALLGWLVLIGAFLGGPDTVLSTGRFLLAFCLFLIVPVLTKNKTTFTDCSFVAFGSLWLGLSFQAILQLRLAHGLALFLFVLFAIWATDIGAFFIGKQLKGPKIWPAISPNKTVSGTVGGLLLAFLTGGVFEWLAGQALASPLLSGGFLNWGLFGVLLSVTGQLGDFVESALKRSFSVKDSGNILPGHGGILDRFDSLIAAGPVAYYVITHGVHWIGGV